MTEPAAFVLLLVGIVGAGPLAYRIGRRGPRAAAIDIAAGFLAIGLALVCRYRPELAGRAVSGTHLALLYPGVWCIAGVWLLSALASRTTTANRRAVLLLVGLLASYGVANASFLLRDPGAALGRTGRWQGRCYLQSTGWSCAPSAACSLLRHLGVETSEAEMARLMASAPHYGTGDLRIQMGLERKLGRGYRVELARPGYDGLVARGAPGVASIRLELFLNHAVAVVAADAERVTVLDPLSGEGRLSREAFERMWNGTIVFVERE